MTDIDALELLDELDGLPPQSRSVVDQYLAQYSVRTNIRNHQILKRMDELVARGIDRTQAVSMISGEIGLEPSTIWRVIREC